MLWFSLTLEVLTPIFFQPQERSFKGGMWHGMLEAALHQRSPELRALLTDGHAHQRARYALFPPLDSAANYPTGTQVKCALILYGEACAYWTEVLSALLIPCAMKLGRQRTPLRVLQIDSMHPNCIAVPVYRLNDAHLDGNVIAIDAITHNEQEADCVNLTMLTPISISSPNKRIRGLDHTPISLTRWVKALRLRLCELEPRLAKQFEFQSNEWLTQEHALRDAVLMRSEIRLQNWTYGSRTKTKLISLYGQVGSMHFAGRIPPRVLDLLALGQWLGIGQRTTLGHGWYRLG